MSEYRNKIREAKATRKYRLSKKSEITPYIRKHLKSIRKECARLPENKWCSVAAWTILQREKVDIFREDKVWDIPQKVRQYIKEIITTDYDEDAGPLYSVQDEVVEKFNVQKDYDFVPFTNMLIKQVELIDKQIAELKSSRKQLQTAIKAVSSI